MPLLDHLDIANAACARIGIEPLESFGDETIGGQQAQLVYDETLDFNLGLYPVGFGFSKQIRQLSRDDTVTPLTGYTYVYSVPAECLGLPVYITDDATDPDRRFDRFVYVGRKVHSDPDTLFAMIRFRPDPSLWSPTFKSAMITSLAAKYAISAASDRALADDLKVEAYGSPVEAFRGGQMGAAIREESWGTPPRQTDWVSRNPLARAYRGGGWAPAGIDYEGG